MKIKCDYCGTYINDTLATCPNCGSPVSGVKRTANGQPMTIEELKQWYEDRHLPPYETTRFFIGENYQGPRAFGIYKDEKGNFVVYKNKDSGDRAIRYRGTDESYAVNELLQRLKQEILQQKAARNERQAQAMGGSRGRSGNYPSRNGADSGSSSDDYGSYGNKSYDPETYRKELKKYHKLERREQRRRGCRRGCLKSIIVFMAMILLGSIIMLVENEPAGGYYSFDNACYYYLDSAASDRDTRAWFKYDDSGSWGENLDKKEVPELLHKNKSAKHYFLQQEWDESLDCTDFIESPAYTDYLHHYRINRGYYQYDNTVYYHLNEGRYDGWYYYSDYDDDWYPVEPADIPDDLTHSVTSWDSYEMNTWDPSTQYSDFSDTEYYKDYYDYDSGSSSSWFDDDDDDYDWSWDDDDYDYDSGWDSGSDWDSGWDSGGSDWDSDW